MQDYKLLFNIFTKTNNKIITTILAFLIFVLILAFFSFISAKSITVSYKTFIFNNYIGSFGTIYFKVKKVNPKYLASLKQFNSIVYFQTKKDIKINNQPQKVKLIIWKKGNFINKTLERLYGKKLTLKGKTILFKVIDTGFLHPEMTLFLNEQTAKELGYKFKYNYISIKTDIDKKIIDTIKSKLQKINDSNMIEYNTIHDILSDNKELLEELSKIEKLQNSIFISILMLTFIIIIGGLFIFLNMKRKSIFIMRVYGVSANTIAFLFSLFSGFLLLISLFISDVLFIYLKSYYKDLVLENVDLNIYIYAIVLIMFLDYILFKISLKEIKK